MRRLLIGIVVSAMLAACGGKPEDGTANAQLKVTAATFTQVQASQQPIPPNAAVSPSPTTQTVSADPFKAFLDANKKGATP